MNKWIQWSIDFANQKNYLDELFNIYPTIPGENRILDQKTWQNIQNAYQCKNDYELIKLLLQLELFPIKDSYVAYLKRDSSSIHRNPKTIKRLCERLYKMGIDEVYEKCTEPKETNRQIGPMFKDWIKKDCLGLPIMSLYEFNNSQSNAVLCASDAEMKDWAEKKVNYKHNKGLDLVARVNGKYVIGEAKFLTDYGGHQNAQFNDAINTITANVDAIKVAILDGVLYIKSENKMHTELTTTYCESNIMSSLILREFINQL